MTAALIVGPALEPVSLEDVKAHLRIDDDAGDDWLGAAITAARIHVETTIRRVLIAQTWRIYRDDWPATRIVAIRVTPLISIDEVTVYDADGEPVTVPEEDYEVDAVSAPARLVLKAGASAPGRAVNGIEIDVTAGYGVSSVDVPGPLRQAVLATVAHWHEHRGAIGGEPGGGAVPAGVEALIAPYRLVTL